ncbi:MAG: glycosyltransferase [Sulfuricellaceae bacterium]
MRHRYTGYQLLHGKGLEIGAFLRPAQLPDDCTVIYADVGSRDDLCRNYPELTPEALAPVDVVVDMDKSALACFPADTFDFVVMNQVVAHLANPIRALEEVFRVVRPGGLVAISSHDKLYSFDRKCDSTSFEHLLDEHRQGVEEVADDHYVELLRVIHPRVFYQSDEEVGKIINTFRKRHEATHTWDSDAFSEFLVQAMAVLNIHAVKRYESLGQDNKLECFTVWQKYAHLPDLTLVVADSNRQFESAIRRLHESETLVEALRCELAAQETRLAQLLGSHSWRLSKPLRLLGKLARFARSAVKSAIRRARAGAGGMAATARMALTVLRKMPVDGPRMALREVKYYLTHGCLPAPEKTQQGIQNIAPVARDHKIAPNQVGVDIVVCVHNAPEDVERCLSSVVRCTLPPYSLILVDDGSDEPTRDYLRRFAFDQDALLIRNEAARGYTLAANQGLQASSAEYVVLLNSDTIVSPNWLDRMAMCAASDAAIGIVGPLSNTASWQSVPELEEQGDWANNPLPQGVTVEQMATRVAHHSARLYPRIPFLNGFCLMIKRQLIDAIGQFDEAAFGRGYGEENDYCLRARKAGWALAIADDAYVFHAQSKSYSHERRKQLCDQAGAALAAKHGHEIIEQGVLLCREDSVLQGMRARARLMSQRQELIDRGQEAWEGKRVLFVMPVMAAGGGANVVIYEARAMIAMGADVRILNLKRIREPFEASYPGLDIPVVYADKEDDFARLSAGYDAVIATANHTVQWLTPLTGNRPCPTIGYYIQDFEPYFYAQDTKEYRIALDSYSAIQGMVLFTKTEWNRDEIAKITGQQSAIVGPSFDADLFMPRRRQCASPEKAPIRICAMVRPSSPRREPLLTLRVLRRIQHAYANKVEIVIFGVENDDPNFLSLPCDFSFVNLGLRTPEQMAALLNEMDVFADFSSYQAMGLTAMEAMGCGVAVIVPRAGGAASFAQDGENALLTDTSDENECYKTLERLVVDHDLRLKLQRRALLDIVHFAPENAAFNILQALFGKVAEGQS